MWIIKIQYDGQQWYQYYRGEREMAHRWRYKKDAEEIKLSILRQFPGAIVTLERVASR